MEVVKEVPVESIVYEQGDVIIKEVPVEKVVVTEVPVIVEKIVEKIVYRECVSSSELEVESISVYPNGDSVSVYLSTNLESEAFLRVWPAYHGFDYNPDFDKTHTLQKGDLRKGTEYYYQVTLINEDGSFVKKNGDFFVGE
ncbi:MAG TPA: hypothetical protein ENG81_01120 [Candidatus Bathyarchaeota archaeon]|nr:hypothetical protein [Candidatus Bathyarchaeota archaeon]